jgi:hypothetical protein
MAVAEAPALPAPVEHPEAVGPIVRAGESEPLRSIWIASYDVHSVSRLYGVAVGANRLCFLPGTYASAEYLEAVILD